MPLITSRIEALKERLKLSNKDICEAVGVKENTVWRWMSGKSQPASIHLSKLAEVLGTSSSFILGDTNDPTPPKRSQVDLTEDEYRILDAYRRGDWRGLMRLIGGEE
jgi:transcriptional regulator with XRE-family HTH domain